jgi:transcription antitermination factor NusG
MQEVFEEEDIPIAEFENIGLSKDGRISLGEADWKALMAGQRTNLLRLDNLMDSDMHIMHLDAKLSLRRNDEGKLDLLIHPVYRRDMLPEYVTIEEAEKLASGELTTIDKIVYVNGVKKEVLVEFDQDTNEFVITDAEQILAPDFVNDEKLSEKQKSKFKKGEAVELEDGTKFRYSATAPQGMRSNKKHLIASIIIDGGLSFILYKALMALSKKEPKVSEQYSKGYYQALEDMNVRKVKDRMRGPAR